MIFNNKLLHGVFLAIVLLMVAPLAGPAAGVFGSEAAYAQTVSRISIEGNQRVGDSTIVSYLTIGVGDAATASALSASTNSLLASGLFSDARVTYSGGTLRVTVSENPIVASVLFEGNQRFNDKQLLAMVDVASRGVFTDERLATDVQSIKLAYDQAGYTNVGVTARTEVLENARVRVTFVINEGDRAGIAAINFTGNNSIPADQLKSVIRTKETHLLSWLFKDDSYDEDRLSVDSELIRLAYANRGFPDAQVLSAVAEFDESRNAYFINFTISEGERYRFGNIGIETSITGLNTDALKSTIKTYEGNQYSYKHLQQTVQDMALAATEQGYAFADVRPRIDRDIANRTFNITYLVDEGARLYVERINIIGNSKTRDFVIRRELDFAEGDPFNRSLVTRGKASIEELGYFNSVNITTEQGSAPDKVVITIAVDETSTGDYGATVGYSTDEGLLGEVSLTERNFLGRGQYLRIALGATSSGRTFDFSFTEPRFMGLKVSAGIDVYKRITDEKSTTYYGTDATGAQLRFGLPITDALSTTLFVGGESKLFKDNDPADSVIVTDAMTRNSIFVGYKLTLDTIEDKENPSGFIGSLSQRYVGLDNNFIDSQAVGRYYLPLMEDSGVVASIKGQAGILTDLSGTGVHAAESYFKGSDLVRGFTTRGMGPRNSGQPIGATWYAGLSGEIEFPIPALPESWGLSTAVWGDLGYVGPASSAAPATTSGATEPLRASVGASIIWDSPFGPLRGDFAHVVKKDPADSTQVFQLTLQSLL